MISKKIISITSGLALISMLALAIPAFAQENKGWQGRGGDKQGQSLKAGQMGNRGKMIGKPAIVGIVSAVNGSTLTVTGRQGFGSSTASVSYTVDATNATVIKNNATSTLSSISVGDNVFVQGTTSGTNITATAIRDGAPGMGRGDAGRPRMASSTLSTLGNGQPVVAGKVSAINGNSITLTTLSNLTYTVDASNAKVLEGQKTVTLSDVSTGDTVLVQGTISGTSIVATTLVDQSKVSNNTKNNPQNNKPRGMLGGVGQFFMQLFGF